MSSSPNITLPPNLEKISLETFDNLLSQKEILYEPPKIDIVSIDGIQFHFSTTPVLGSKPVLSANDPGRSKPVGLFVNPPESFIVARIGTSHKIIVNKYNVYKPMLILHTTLFTPQTTDLTPLDISIAWSLLSAFKTPQMIIYNCGVEAGSSQGHKHMQIFPRQDGVEFGMWPDSILDARHPTPNIPFTYFLSPLPPSPLPTPASMFTTYLHLLSQTKTALRAAGAGTDYNLILVREWILLIPRTSKGRGRFIANAANMVGLMWVKSEEVRDEVVEGGVGVLEGLGVQQ